MILFFSFLVSGMREFTEVHSEGKDSCDHKIIMIIITVITITIIIIIIAIPITNPKSN